jgi:hypothetical protein
MPTPNIELIKSPPTVALLDEGIKYQVQSNRNAASYNAALFLTMSETAANYLDKYFTVEFMGIELQFYLRLAPDQSGLEITTWLGADSLSQFVTKICAEINANYLINQYYVAYNYEILGVAKLAFAAKNDGTLYNITLKATDITDVSVYQETAGIDSVIADDYSIYVAPYIYSGLPLTTDALGKELLPINDDNIVEADLSEYLKSSIITQFTYPFNGVYARTLADGVKKYYIKYAEYENGSMQLLRSTYDNPKYVIRGGLKRIDSDFFYNEDGNYFDYANNFQRFLNWAPTEKITYPGVPELLYFLKSTTGNLTVKLKMKKVDVAEATSTLVTITADQYTITELSVGLADLLPAEDGTNVEWFEIWIENLASEAVSEVRKFTVDQTFYLNKRVLFFQNSFDLYETICCTGVLQVDDSFKQEEIEVLKGPVFRRAVINLEQAQVYTLSSGFLPGIEYRNWLTEVMLSKDTFLMLGHFLLPVIITNKKVNRSKDREHLYSITFSFEADFTESRYSSIVGDGAYFLLDENGVVLLDENNIGLIAS